MEIHIIANKLQSSKIEWLGKSPKATSLQDSQNRTIILVRFLHWFYSEFLNNLVGSFWYVTETSRGSGMELLFYPHLIWSEITTPWMTNYELNNLKDVTSTCNIHGHNVNGKGFYHGKLRLIPKPNDFRLLCIPIKSKSSQFNHHMYNYIYPVRSLLREKLNKKSKTSKYPSCHSTVEVIIKLKEFLKLSNRKGEKLFLIKFDMKQCYDMLNKRQTVIIVEKLLQDNTSNKNTTYYFREMGKAKKLVSQFRSQFYEIKNKSSIDKLSPFNHSSQNKENSTILDRSRTKVLTEKEVLQVVESQIFLSAIIRLDQATLRISCYGRQRGVFQGFPLLGTLSEIVYCDLVETYFNFLPKENSVILRLADDFLVLSTDRIQCEKVRNLILKGFDETHGAIVNTDKTVTINLDPNSSSSEVLFTGFKFNPNTLEIDRTDPEIKINSKNLMSFKSIFSYLLLYYKRKLRDSVFDDVDSFCTILNNVEVIIRGTLYSLTANLKYIMKLKEGYLDEDAAAEFFLNLIFITLNELNCNMEITESLILIFKECFQQILLECTYLKDVLEVLIAVMNLNID